MEDIVEAAIFGGYNDDDIENLILYYFLGNEADEENVPQPQQIFDLDLMTPEEIMLNFRFERDDIYRLARALGLPPQIHTPTGNVANGVTALCMVLRRLSYPNRLSDLHSIFGLSPQSLSQIINFTIHLIINNYGHLLENLENLQWLNREKLEYYSHAVFDKGGAIPNCWGFIDGTARPICRPSLNQQEYYSGHKRHHCVKYQSVLTPDGIIVSLKGAYPGRRHDAGIFRDSNLYNELERVASFANDEKYVLYGDQAYGILDLLLSPFQNRPDMPAHHEAFNISMRTLRVAVEWGFGKLVSEFAFIDFKKNQKLLLQDLEAMFKIAVLFCNCHTCIYGSVCAQYFDVVPPELEEYLGANLG